MASTSLNAARRGDVQAIRELYSATEFVLEETRDEPCETLLHIAAEFGHDAFVEEVISKLTRSQIKQPNQYGFMAIHIACMNGKLQVLQTLLTNCPYLKFIRAGDGTTPLHCALKTGNAEISNFILHTYPDSIFGKIDFGESVLQWVTKNHYNEAFVNLLDFVKNEGHFRVMNERDTLGNTLIHTIVCARNCKALEDLLEWAKDAAWGLELDARNNSGETALDLCPPSSFGSPYYSMKVALKQAWPSPLPDASSSSDGTSNEDDSSPKEKFRYSMSAVGDVERYLKETRSAMGPNEIRVDLLLLFTVGASIAYQGGMNPPVAPIAFPSVADPNGQAWTTMSPSPSPTGLPDGCDAFNYIFFVFFNGVAFYTSVFSLMIVVPHFRLFWHLNLVLLALLVCYNYTLITNTPEGPCRMIVSCYCLFMPGILFLLSRLSVFLITRRIRMSEQGSGPEPRVHTTQDYERVPQEVA